jgi:ribonuclease HIII
MINSTKTFLVPTSLLPDIKSFYVDHETTSPHPAITFFAKLEHFTLSVYASKTQQTKLLFQGHHFDDDVKLWMKPKAKDTVVSQTHYGSDEVGTGDFFGPVVVTASLVQDKDVAWLNELGIKDSKLITDAMILKMADDMTGKIHHVTTLVNPMKYQTMIAKGYNLNEIKAKLHHHALLTLKEKVKIDAPMIIDQFASESKFAEYLKDQAPIPKLKLVEKAENQYLAVAASSILARAKFIRAMNDLGRLFMVKIPFGASDKVEMFAYEFAQHHGLETLKSICKTNFKTLVRITAKLKA